MAKFKNKKTGKVVEANLIYYINLLRSNPEYKEIKEKELKKEVPKEVEESISLQ